MFRQLNPKERQQIAGHLSCYIEYMTNKKGIADGLLLCDHDGCDKEADYMELEYNCATGHEYTLGYYCQKHTPPTPWMVVCAWFRKVMRYVKSS